MAIMLISSPKFSTTIYHQCRST